MIHFSPLIICVESPPPPSVLFCASVSKIQFKSNVSPIVLFQEANVCIEKVSGCV